MAIVPGLPLALALVGNGARQAQKLLNSFEFNQERFAPRQEQGALSIICKCTGLWRHCQ